MTSHSILVLMCFKASIHCNLYIKNLLPSHKNRIYILNLDINTYTCHTNIVTLEYLHSTCLPQRV